MKNMAAYSLLVIGGNEAPNAEEVAAFMKECGIKANTPEINIMINALAGKKIDDMIVEGNDKMFAMAAPAVPEVVEVIPVPEKSPAIVEEEVTNFGGLFGDGDEYGDEY